MSRVFVLGAGASRAATAHLKLPMPLAHEFFCGRYLNAHWPAMWVEELKFENSRLLELLQNYFGVAFTFRDGKCIRGPRLNIEDVMSFVDSIRRNDRTLFQRDQVYFEDANRRLMEYIVEAVRTIANDLGRSRKKGHRDVYATIAANLQEDDSIITFNWDAALDDALEASPSGRKLLARFMGDTNRVWCEPTVPATWDGFREEYNASCYLKMHGAVNMTICDEPDCPRFSAPVVFTTAEELPELWACDKCGGPFRVCLMPPQFNKNYHDRIYFRYQYALARRKLRLADEIIVMGYSFPIFDFDAQALFRSSRPAIWEGCVNELQRITFVDLRCASDEYRRRVFDVFSVGTKSVCERAHGRQISCLFFDDVASFVASGLL